VALYNAENAAERNVHFMSNVDKQMNICFDHKAPSIVIEIEEYRYGYVAWAVCEGEELSHTGILRRTTRKL
jgi:hypothetical protein